MTEVTGDMPMPQPDSTPTAPALDRGNTIERLVVPVDTRDDDEQTVALAATLADTWGVGVQLVRVTPTGSLADPRLEEITARIRASHGDLPIGVASLRGDDPGSAIVGYIGPCDLTLMSSSHIDAWRIKGSVATTVLDAMAGPVLLIGPRAARGTGRGAVLRGPVVVGVDGSPPAESGVEAARELARATGNRLVLARVVHDPENGDRTPQSIAERYLVDLAERTDGEAEVEWEVVQHNDPVTALRNIAGRLRASFLVTARRERADASRHSMASIAAGLGATAPCPVLIVTAPRTGAADRG